MIMMMARDPHIQSIFHNEFIIFFNKNGQPTQSWFRLEIRKRKLLYHISVYIIFARFVKDGAGEMAARVVVADSLLLILLWPSVSFYIIIIYMVICVNFLSLFGNCHKTGVWHWTGGNIVGWLNEGGRIVC